MRTFIESGTEIAKIRIAPAGRVSEPLALASFAGPVLAIDEATLCSRQRNAANIVASWLLELSHEAFLIAVDAPLGDWFRTMPTKHVLTVPVTAKGKWR